MIENSYNYSDNNEENLITRYESMLASNSIRYFDVEEFENILDYHKKVDVN